MNSLRSRLLLAAGAILVLFVLVTAIALDRADHERAEEAIQGRLQGLVYSVLSSVEVQENGTVEIDETSLPDSRFAQYESGLGALVAETSGEVIWRTTSLLNDPAVPSEIPVGRWRLLPATKENPFFSLALGVSWALDNSERRFTILVAEDSETFLLQRAKFRRSLWLWLGVSAILLLGILLAILYWGLSPVRRLTREIQDLQSGRRENISSEYPDELQPLAHSLNALISNERLRQSRYRLALDDLAHSLKTPLAVLRAEVGEQPDCHQPLQQMQQQIDYHLKRAMAGSGQTFGQHTSLSGVIDPLCKALGKVYADKDLQFHCEIETRLQLPVERGDLMEVMGNLLENASKWCNQHVSVQASQAQGRVRIIIEDDGPGFPNDSGKLLQRGIRADLQKEGQGIGLALVADIIQSLGGEITLKSSSRLGGARVEIALDTA